jgi:signal transduction histidine kinase
MYLLFGSIYYYLCETTGHSGKVFVIIAILLLIGSHLLLSSPSFDRYFIWLISFDFAIIASFGFIFADITDFSFIMFGILAFVFFTKSSDKKVLRIFICLFFVTWGFITYFTFLKTNQFHSVGTIINIMFVVFCALVGRLIRKLNLAQEKVALQYEQLSVAHEQLRSYSKQVEELTVIQERNQIAREIHDTVGHKMTALLVQLQLTREFMNLDLEKGKQTIQNCEGLAREALEEIRTSVRTLHEDDGLNHTFMTSLQKLLKDFSQLTSMEISFEIDGDPSTTPTSIQPAITRIIQETLTNSKRHGNATECHIDLSCKPDFVTLRIRDNGKGVSKIDPSFGLINMRERVIEHGGSILYESKDGQGFIVKVEFPLRKMFWSTGGAK